MRIRPFFENEIAGALFVARVHVGKQIDHGNRVDLFCLQGTGSGANSVFVQCFELIAFKVDTATGLEGLALRRQRRGALEEVIERVAVTGLLLDFLDRAIPPGDQHPDLCTAHFQQGVGGDRGAVGKEFNRCRLFTPGDEAVHPFEHAKRRVRRCGRHLFDLD